MKATLLMLTLLSLSVSARADDPPSPAEQLAPFKRALMGALKTGLEQGGPASAIDVCRLQAPGLAVTHAPAGTQIGRSSHRLRNPANAPADWLKPVLADYLANPASTGPRHLTLDDGSEAYVEPIFTQPLCLACHGTTLDTAVQASLEEHYPQDQATGFQEGDLRGVFWLVRPPR